MGTVYLHGNGGSGGGGGLNFAIKTYESESALPETAKENTIAVYPVTEMSSYIFSATQPENPEPYMVWISTGTSSTVEFNGLKKNGIQIYPISAKQYVNGDWADKTAKSYQGDKWVDWWNGELFLYGNEFKGVTGGWITTPMQWKSSGDGSVGGQVTITNSDNGGKKVTISKNHGVLWHTANKIDLSKVNTIKFKGELSKSDYTALGLYTELKFLKSNVGGEISGIKTYGEYTLDVSDMDGSYYIGFRLYSLNNYVVMDELLME